MKRWIVLALLVLSGCGAPALEVTQAPTLGPLLSAGAEPSRPAAGVTPLAPLPAQAPLPTGTLSSASPGDYHALIAAARTMHPYPESAEVMWQVLMCESSGLPNVEGPGGLIGLFQYSPETWQGAWNPYRDQSVTDAQAQIYATAKAWSDGNQHWWSACIP